ncbi:ABC transporter ATP-binding protein [Rothia sp. P7208]|uniref:ABC transporter ATP-binding protein n=1 Tax=Rothia sp. P7208 TaxID=3402660 RepID=UPI003ACBCC46
MKKIYQRMRILFPGKRFFILILNVIGLFLLALFDMVGIAAIMPIVQLATGSEINGYLSWISDFLGNPGRSQLIIYLSILLIFSFIFKGVASLAIKWWSSIFIARQQTTASVSLLNKYSNEPYLVNRNRPTAETLRAIDTAANQAYTTYVGGVVSALGELFTIVVILVLLVAVIPETAFVAFAYFGFFAFLLQFFLKKRNSEQGAKIINAAEDSIKSAMESIMGFRENLMHGVTQRSVYGYQNKRSIFVEASRRGIFYQDLPKYILEIVFIIGLALLLGVLTLKNGDSSAPFLLLFSGACVRMLPSFTRLVASIGYARIGEKGVEVLEKDLEELGKNGEFSLIGKDPEIGRFANINDAVIPIDLVIEDLSFKYPDGQKNVLNDINLVIPQGTSIAFVGGSGSGKTTLVDIILGLIEPDSGRVLCNDKNIHDDREDWFSYIGYVPQDVFLGDSTVKEAVAFGLRENEIDLKRVWECLRMAELDDFVKSMEYGLDQKIGEQGSRLSGGQRQRLGIARAMYRRPSILVLDEATAALDNETEHRITETINKISQEITVIIVAHRLSTIRKVDQVVFLSDGVIQDIGTFEEVQLSNSEFAKLVELGQLG